MGAIADWNRREINKLDEHYKMCNKKRYLLKTIKDTKRYIREIERLLKNKQYKTEIDKYILEFNLLLCRGLLQSYTTKRNDRR